MSEINQADVTSLTPAVLQILTDDVHSYYEFVSNIPVPNSKMSVNLTSAMPMSVLANRHIMEFPSFGVKACVKIELATLCFSI